MEDSIKFTMEGTREDILIALHNCGIANIKDAEILLDYLLQEQRLLGDDEVLEIEEKSLVPGMMGLTFCEDTYYVSVKTLTIVTVALLLDLSLTKGFAATAMSLFGVSSLAFAKIEEQEGEKCILRETLIQKQKTGDVHILEKNGGKCCNPLSCCKYRIGEVCKCTKNVVYSIYEKLCEKNVCKKRTGTSISRKLVGSQLLSMSGAAPKGMCTPRYTHYVG